MVKNDARVLTTKAQRHKIERQLSTKNEAPVRAPHRLGDVTFLRLLLAQLVQAINSHIVLSVLILMKPER